MSMTNLVLQEMTAPTVLSAQAGRVSLEAQHEELSQVRVADTPPHHGEEAHFLMGQLGPGKDLVGGSLPPPHERVRTD